MSSTLRIASFALIACASTCAFADEAPAAAEPCAQLNLNGLLSARRQQIPALMSDLDGQIQSALLVERRQLAANAEIAKHAETGGPLGNALVLLLAALGAGLAAMSAARRSFATLTVALAIFIAAGGLGYRRVESARRTESALAVGLERSLDLASCHLRLTEARMALERSRLAYIYWRLDELDEDVNNWRFRLTNGGAVTDEELVKMRGEMNDATH